MGFLDHECQEFVSAGISRVFYLLYSASLQSRSVPRMNNAIKAHLCVHDYYLPGKLLWQILWPAGPCELFYTEIRAETLLWRQWVTLELCVCVLPNRCSPYGKDFCKCLHVFICRSVFVKAFCSGQVLRVVKCLGTAKCNFVCGRLHCSWGK